jgi:hypothetical protein
MGIGRPFQCLLANFVKLRQVLILALDFSSGPLTNFKKHPSSHSYSQPFCRHHKGVAGTVRPPSLLAQANCRRASGEFVRWKHHLNSAREDETRLSAERTSASLSAERTPFLAAVSSVGISRTCFLSLAELKAGPVGVHECAAANLSLNPVPSLSLAFWMAFRVQQASSLRSTYPPKSPRFASITQSLSRMPRKTLNASTSKMSEKSSSY